MPPASEPLDSMVSDSAAKAGAPARRARSTAVRDVLAMGFMGLWFQLSR
jgi:hypothetical protein